MAEANMLQVMIDRLSDAGRSLQPIARICMLGSLKHGVDKSFYEKWCRKQLDQGEVTGLLLLMPTGWIQLLEGSHALLVAFLRSLDVELGTTHEAIKVIHAAEDVPKRMFRIWNAREVNIARKNYAEVNTKLLPSLLGETTIGGPFSRCKTFLRVFPIG